MTRHVILIDLIGVRRRFLFQLPRSLTQVMGLGLVVLLIRSSFLILVSQLLHQRFLKLLLGTRAVVLVQLLQHHLELLLVVEPGVILAPLVLEVALLARLHRFIPLHAIIGGRVLEVGGLLLRCRALVLVVLREVERLVIKLGPREGTRLPSLGARRRFDALEPLVLLVGDFAAAHVIRFFVYLGEIALLGALAPVALLGKHLSLRNQALQTAQLVIAFVLLGLGGWLGGERGVLALHV